MDDENLLKATEVFDTLCECLDDNKWCYTKDKEDMCVELECSGTHMDIKLVFSIDAERQRVILMSGLSCSIPKEKIIDTAVAVSVINRALAAGNFDYDIQTGRVLFRLTSSYEDSRPDKEIFSYMVYASSLTVDKYNEKFYLLGKGKITVEEFLKEE